MSLITIILFFVYIYGFGYAATYFLKENDNFLERNLMRMGIGLGILPILMLLMSFLRIPLDWRLILLLSLLFPIYSIFVFFKNRKKIKFDIRIKKSDLYIFAAFVLFLLSLFMYTKGAFVYPYLEDDDPWSHANGVKYVSIEKSIFNPDGGTGYLDPYPPAYDGLLGLLHQTSPSLMWTMKFFNALIISLSILFFYFFSKEFIGDQKKALFATFVLASIPSYLSHFIWAHSLVPILIILAFYSLEMIKYDRKYMYVSALVIGSIFLTTPTQPIKFSIMFLIYFLVKFIYSRKISFYVISSGALGFILSLIWWTTRWKEQLGSGARLGASEIEATASLTGMDKIVNFFGVLGNAFHPRSGTATRVYSFEDFFIAKHQNMINNPVGIGIFISLLLIVSLVFIIIKYKALFKKNSQWILISLLWLIFTYLGINSMTFNLPIGLFAFRFWMLFAIPVALLSVLGMWLLFNIASKFNIPKIFILIVVIVGILFTSAHQKYSVNTAIWPPGAFWTSNEEIQGYMWFKDNIPSGTKVFTFSNNALINGLDKFICNWCNDVRDYQSKGFNQTIEQNYDWLKKDQYKFVIIDGQAARKFGANETNKKLQELINSIKFKPVFNNDGMIIFEVI